MLELILAATLTCSHVDHIDMLNVSKEDWTKHDYKILKFNDEKRCRANFGDRAPRVVKFTKIGVQSYIVICGKDLCEK